MSDWSAHARGFARDLVARGFAVRSQETYQQDLASFVNYLRLVSVERPQDLTPEHLLAYQTHLYEQPGARGTRLSLCTQARCLTVARSFCDYLYRRGLVLMDPSRKLIMPRLDRKLPAVILTTREVSAFLRAIDTHTPLGVRDRAIFETLYSTGMRVSEMLALAPADVDLVEGFVRVRRGKGGKARVVPLGRIAARWVERYLAIARAGASPVGPLFVSFTGRPLSRRVMTDLVRRWAWRASLKKPITCHAFRHACATHMLRGRASLRHIQELLGHASAKTTQIYTHVAILDLKRVHQRCHPRSRRA